MDHLQAKLISTEADTPTIEALILKHGPEEAVRLALEAGRTGTPVTKALNSSLAQMMTTPGISFNGAAFELKGDTLYDEDVAGIINATTDFFQCSESVGSTGRWVLGNIASILKNAGNDLSGFRESHQVLNAAITTYELFEEKRYPMCFSHHKAIAYASSLSAEQKHQLAEMASTQGYTFKQINLMIKYGQAQVEKTEKLPSPEQLNEAAITLPKVKRTKQKPKQYLLISGADHEIVDGKLGDHQIADADSVFEIGRIIKEPR